MDAHVALQIGCEHNCRYCCSRHDTVTKFKRCTAEQWKTPRINAHMVDRSFGTFNGSVVFPSTHDITDRNIAECLVVLRKLLEAGNQVVIVSKPAWKRVSLLCESLKQWQHQITFRFTLGSVSNDVLRFWEPAAPNFESRLRSLTTAYFEGYATSVSCEPYLDGFAHYTYEACHPYLTESFWIGKLRRWDSRVDLAGATPEQLSRYVEPLKAAQSDEFVREMVRQLDGRRYIRWWPSVREVIEKEAQRGTGTEAQSDKDKATDQSASR